LKLSMKKTEPSYQIRKCIFAYKCEADWELLEDTNKEKIRFCNACEKEVHFCEDDKELTEAIHANHCVAFERVEKRSRLVKMIGLIRPDPQ
jgi:hypothetical protein